MDQRIATATVIRGNGGCQVFIDGVVNAELQRQQMMMQAERERAHMIEGRRNRMLGERLKASAPKRRSPLERLKDAIETAWAMVWAITAGKCWLDMGETAGLWVDENRENERKF